MNLLNSLRQEYWHDFFKLFQHTRIWCLCLLLGSLPSCTREKQSRENDVLTISVEQHSAWIRNFNPFSPNARRFTRAGIHEPLMVYNSITGKLVPWLATAYHWDKNYRVLTFTIREGVRFSDGQALTLEDVLFSFRLLKKYPALDTGGFWTSLVEVKQSADQQISLILNEPFQPKLLDFAQHIIVPKHIWEKVKNPVAFTNPQPVGTGPFTEVTIFRDQIFELSKNPYYWQVGRPLIRSLRFPAFPSNDQANLALVRGEIDWAGNFVPAIDRTFVARDPQHHFYWFPLVGSMVNLITNTQKKPFDQVLVRQALSQALDREKIVEVAMYGYTRAADTTGLSDGFKHYHSQDIAQQYTWTKYQPKKAIQLLEKAGLKKDKRGWYDPKSKEILSYTIDVVNGWSDWVRAAQVISRQLHEVGIKVRVRTSEFSSWFDRLRKGQFELAIAWADDRSTPYEYYRWLMSQDTVKPIGESTAGNFHRFADLKTDEILVQLKQGVDAKTEFTLVQRLQKQYASLVPVIPLFPNPQWGAANTSRICGFPNQNQPYAALSPNREPESLLVFTKLKPCEKLLTARNMEKQ